jgi:hypothetical protein
VRERTLARRDFCPPELIWRLTEGLVPYGVSRYHRDDVMYAADAPFALIGWEYEVGNTEDGELGRVRGLYAGSVQRSHVPPPTPWQKENASRAGVRTARFSVF